MKKTSHNAFTLIELLVVISIIAVLASIAIPVYGRVQEQGQQTKAVAQVKGIFTGLMAFANDNNGAFPSLKDEMEAASDGSAAGEVTDANEAFANLVPTYVQSEKPFGIPNSAYCKKATVKGPDDDMTSKTKILQAGENTYAYVKGLTTTSSSAYPIIADGFTAGSTSDPTYTTLEGEYGGVWKGKKAIVVRLDGSATLENVDSTTKKVIRKGAGKRNLFKSDASTTDPWLSGAEVLNPKI